MSHDASLTATPPRTPPRAGRAVGVLLALALIGVGAGLALRAHDYRRVVHWTEAQELPFVNLVTPQASDSAQALALPGRLSAWNVVPIRAQVTGYLKSWNYDIGSRVKAGDELASIDTPDLDQQLEQAKAALARAQANARLAQVTSARWQNLLKSNSVSKQEADEKSSTAAATEAEVLAARANVDRLQALESFKRIVAPFSGVITARPNETTNVGNLIVANSDSLPQLFTLADTSKLRLYVPVPQSYAGSIRPGMHAQLSVLEHPGETFTATLLNSSQAVNQASGTLLAQFEIDNRDGKLLPGDYAEVSLPVRADARLLQLPATALIFRADGPQVAVLGKDGRVELRAVHINMDLGQTLQIDRGIAPGDRIIDHPPDSLSAGDQVRIADEGVEHAKHAA